jgi:hypothetical protein
MNDSTKEIDEIFFIWLMILAVRRLIILAVRKKR